MADFAKIFALNSVFLISTCNARKYYRKITDVIWSLMLSLVLLLVSAVIRKNLVRCRE